jgi:5-methylcytosine-specific restriction protein A
MAGARNPAWDRDELILALALYFKFAPKLPPSTKHPEVVELSRLLNTLPIIPLNQRNEKFRNPSSVYMKLANFRAIDPSAPSGFSSVGRLDREIWEEFAHDLLRLEEAATEIRMTEKAQQRSAKQQ